MLLQCKCHDPSSLCMTLNEEVSKVVCYCKDGHAVDVNVPCSKGTASKFVLVMVGSFD